MKIVIWMIATFIGIVVASVFFVAGFLYRYAKGGFERGIEYAEEDSKDIFPQVYKK